MPRPRKPTTLKVLKGTAQKCRLNPREPIPNGPLGNAPRNFNDEQKAIWREIKAVSPEGVLSIADSFIVEMLVILLHEFRTDYANFTSGKLARLISILTRVGLTPADRSKISVPKPEEKNNPWNEF